MPNIETQIQSAIANERATNRKRETVKAIVVVFVVIPVCLVTAGLIAAQLGYL